MCSRLFFTLTDILVLLVFGYLVFRSPLPGELSRSDRGRDLGRGGVCRNRPARRQPGADDRNGFRPDEPGDAADVDFLGRVFLVRAVSRSRRSRSSTLLPLTALNQLLRGIMLEGESLIRLWPQIAILAAYTATTFALGLRVFRWL